MSQYITVSSGADGVREIILTINGIQLSAKLAEPKTGQTKAIILAIPGGGYTSTYWHNPACFDASLLMLGAAMGYRVIALDRPGYGASEATFPDGMGLDNQAAIIANLIVALSVEFGLPVCLIGHSMGGILSLMASSSLANSHLLAVDVSGVPRRFSDQLSMALRLEFDDGKASSQGRSARALFYGPKGTFNPQVYGERGADSRESPLTELRGAVSWPDRFAGIVAKIVTPIQYTLGEYERVTRCDWDALRDTGRLFSASPRVVLHQQVDAGHNISLHYVGRAYHLRALAFFDERLIRV